MAIGVLAAMLTLAGTVHALVPTDPQPSHPTYAALNLPAAWDVTTGSPRGIIAIVDSGIDPTHPDLAAAVRAGHDFVDRDPDATDPPGPHGTVGRPGPTLRPVVLGTAAVGSTLEALSGVWPGAGLPVTYQWERCRESCTAIEGATESRYAPVAGDLGYGLRVAVASPPASATTSATTGAVDALPASVTRPSIAGRARVGAVLSARLGTWSGTDVKLTPTWLRCRSGSCWAMKIGLRYRLRAQDRGYRMRLSVLGSNALGTATAFSKPTAIVR